MNSKERMHDELIEKIAESLREAAKKIGKKVIIKKELEYEFRKKGKIHKGKPDIIVVIGRTLYIFEIKTEVAEAKARDKLAKYVADFSEFFSLAQIYHNLPSYSDIKAFWITEQWNCIVSLQTEESFALDPAFFEISWEFLENN